MIAKIICLTWWSNVQGQRTMLSCGADVEFKSFLVKINNQGTC
jgi:hypothetical protein